MTGQDVVLLVTRVFVKISGKPAVVKGDGVLNVRLPILAENQADEFNALLVVVHECQA